MVTAVSLFAGVGGFDLALERSGVDVVASVEIDKNARGVLAHRFPNSRLFEDVTKVSGSDLLSAGFQPRGGIVTGGFPCQDLSIAGRRAGLGGERSGLFFEIVRLLDELKPDWFILENVPGLLSSNGGRDMGIVVSSLVELGYGLAWRVLDAQFFGVPQRRRRVFIVGRFGDDGGTPSEILALFDSVRWDTPKKRSARGDSAEKTERGAYVKTVRSGARDPDGNLPPEQWQPQAVAPTLNVMDNTGDARATVLVPTLLTMREGKSGGGKGPLLSEDKSLTLATANNQVLYYEPRRTGDRIETLTDVAPTITSHWGTGGNNVPFLANTLTASNDPSSFGFRSFNIVEQNDSVRRLTPLECERLQGFPDGWTAQRIGKKGLEPQADSSRYKQMGNAVAVPVVEWVVRQLVAVSGVEPVSPDYEPSRGTVPVQPQHNNTCVSNELRGGKMRSAEWDDDIPVCCLCGCDDARLLERHGDHDRDGDYFWYECREECDLTNDGGSATLT